MEHPRQARCRGCVAGARGLKQSTKLFLDETTVPVLDPGLGRTKTGYLWALARNDRRWGGADPPGVVYDYANGVTLDFSRPGKPTDNAFGEAFNGRLRAECLNTHWFLFLADAAEKLEAWCRYCNEDRPHGAIGYKVPIALMKPGGTPGQPPS